MVRIRSVLALTSVALAGLALCTGFAGACTRVLWNDNGYAVMVSRTMDWPEKKHATGAHDIPARPGA